MTAHGHRVRFVATWREQFFEVPSGYRGVHLIYRYNSDRKTEYNTLLIEMQLRSQLQHAWATAVETWPAPGFEDTELGVLMELEVCHGETEVYPRVQA